MQPLRSHPSARDLAASRPRRPFQRASLCVAPLVKVHETTNFARLARLLVVERRVEPVRPEPSLRSERIEGEFLEIGVLFDLGDEVERWILPPVYLAGGEVVRRVPGFGDVPPDHLIEVRLLAASRSAWRLVARDVVGVPQINGLLTRLPLVLRELERSGADDLLNLLIAQASMRSALAS